MPDDAAALKAVPSRGMGRGLAAILTRGEPGEGDAFRQIAPELIRPNERQPRRHFDDDTLAALAESIRVRGVLQPLVVRPLPGGTYELVAGERRLRAAVAAGLDRVPAIVRETPDAERLELALVENMAREDLNPVEEARACATLVEDLGVTKEELARRLGRSRPAVSNLIRLLALPDDVLALLETGDLSEAHGRALLLCKDHATRRALARRAMDEGWSAHRTEREARKAEEGVARGPAAAPVHPDLEEALAEGAERISSSLGRDVRLRLRGKRLVVEVALDDPADLQALARRLAA